ncbi:MAG: CT253 family lipoprotein [Candidatus Algichlamydia australiensis]|nr:CT253 family lipoprotein [Chlamydiales bacterium]
MKKFLFLSLFLLTACYRSGGDVSSRFHVDGRAKPIVALVPVFDHSDAKLPWSLTDEFTKSIEDKLSKRSKVFLISDEEVAKLTVNLDERHQPFSNEYTWAKETFTGNEFVVFMELVDHEMTPIFKEENFEEENEKSTAHELLLTMRLRIIDLRGEEPEVVLQELIQRKHHIPKWLSNVDYTRSGWGKYSFHVTPFGLAHAQFSRAITKRLEEYILLAKSR